MQVISHTFPGGAELCAYLHEADESMPASLRCEQPAVIIFPGGGYAFTSPREADPVALAFLSMGYQRFFFDTAQENRPGQSSRWRTRRAALPLCANTAPNGILTPKKLPFWAFRQADIWRPAWACIGMMRKLPRGWDFHRNKRAPHCARMPWCCATR